MPAAGIKLVAFLGSAREKSYTGMALRLVLDELELHRDVEVEVVDAARVTLPVPGTAAATADVRRMQGSVRSAAGVIFATPEYHGSFSSATKLFIENLGFPSELAQKPVALLGVAAGRIGAIKSLEQLRGVCSHVGAIVLPGAVSVANVREVFDESGRCSDATTEKHVRGVATSLLNYISERVCPGLSIEQMMRAKSG